jgi:hypothetical protein
MQNLESREIKIDSGTLDLKISYINPNYSGIDDLVAFASRMNKKRGFLFVSKILGKHIPVKPSEMRKSYDVLAREIGRSDSNAVVIGMSETAVGLGGGVADSICNIGEGGKVIFQHTTRHLLKGQKRWFEIDESHSHATSHIIYQPSPIVKMEMENAETLVLVDDEISTGRTLLQLSCGYLQKLPNIKKLHLVALLSWQDDEMEAMFARKVTKFCVENDITVPEIVFNALAKGSFSFEVNENFESFLPASTDTFLEDERSLTSLGRKGIIMPLVIEDKDVSDILDNIGTEKCLAVVGTGEHLFEPFLIAEEIEKRGYETLFQSTTRSPIFLDGSVIKDVVEIPFTRSNGSKVCHFMYNKSEMLSFFVSETNALKSRLNINNN